MRRGVTAVGFCLVTAAMALGPAVAGPNATSPCAMASGECLEVLLQGNGLRYVSFFRTASLAVSNPAVTEAVVVIHGAGRTAADSFRSMVAAAEGARRLETTLVIAPHFKARAGGCHDPVEANELYWSCAGWKYGQAALDNAPDASPIFSFDVVDRLLDRLNDPAGFPSLRRIVVIGHSAGGQFTQRYAAGNRIEPRLHVPVTYVVANPSSYMYLDGDRLSEGGTCRADGTCMGEFEDYRARGTCPSYNRYIYGMEGRTGYMAPLGDTAIRSQYTSRAVVYLLGARDTHADPDLDVTCSAMAQGRNRFERGLVFWNYVTARYHAAHGLVIVPSCAHSVRCMYTSAEGTRAIFH
jgi:pimeloyl-ACP methyl ester carboxylesterase